MRANDLTHWAYSWLTDDEREIMRQWFIDTDDKKLVGEMSLASISLICALIGGSQIMRVVQLGTYAGFSALMMGFALRRHGGRLWTCDIDADVAAYAQRWLELAELDGCMSAGVSSTSDWAIENAAACIIGCPQLIVIDSSHEYGQTTKEIDRWGPVLDKGGFMIFHDSSELAQQYDKTGAGGVRFAVMLRELPEGKKLSINEFGGDVFQDPCGLAIIHKC